MFNDVKEFYEEILSDVEYNGSTAELDQHMTDWRNEMKAAGVDLTDPAVLWPCAVVVERLMAMIADNAEDCVHGEEAWLHVLSHVKVASTPMCLVLDSAIKTYGSLE